jgi:hypothetical protein
MHYVYHYAGIGREALKDRPQTVHGLISWDTKFTDPKDYLKLCRKLEDQNNLLTGSLFLQNLSFLHEAAILPDEEWLDTSRDPTHY